MNTVALTGASGFVGRHVLDRLLQRGHAVRALVRQPGQIQALSNLTPVVGRLDRLEALKELVRGADHLIHLAGATGGFDYDDFARVNVSGTERLIDACLETAPAIRLIHLSSLAAREPDLSDYAASKSHGEDLVRASQLNWVILRPPAVYGPDDAALAPLWQALAKGWLIRTSPARSRFSLIHVDDLASALVALVEVPTAGLGRTLDVDDGHGGYGWGDLKAIAEARLEKSVRVLAVPGFALKTLGTINVVAARLSRRRPPPLVPGKVRELVHHDWVCDNSDFTSCADWQPTITLTSALDELPGWR